MSSKTPDEVIETLIDRFRDSPGMASLAAFCHHYSRMKSIKFEDDGLAASSLHGLDAALAETIVAARAIRAALYREADWYGHPRETVGLACGLGTEKLEPKTAFIEVAPRYIGIGFTDHGVCIMQPDSEVVMVEHIEGAPRVHVFADINREEATHTVELDGSKQTARSNQP